MKLKTWRSSELFWFDIFAAALGVALFAFFFGTARIGVGAPDECFFFSVAHRVSLGERMIADEWNVAQLVHFFNLFPTHLFIKITGGTEGLVLYIRRLFLAAHAICYVFIYLKLRRFKGWGVAAAFLYCAMIVQTLFTFFYFTIAPMTTLAVWLILADDRKALGVPRLFLTGFLMACGILAEPFLIAIYFLWFVLVLIRETRRKQTDRLLADYDFVLNRRTFFLMSVGAAALFFFYMAFMVFGGSFKNVGETLPYILGGAEYNKDNLVDLQKIRNVIGLFGAPWLLGSVISLLASVVWRVKRQDDLCFKRIVFVSAFVFLAAGYVNAAVQTIHGMQWLYSIEYNNFSLLLFSPALWLLCKKKTPRLLLLWTLGILFSIVADISSDVVLGSGGGLVRAACILQLSFLLPELKAEPDPKRTAKRDKKRKRKRKNPEPVLKGIVAVCVSVVLAWNMGYVYCETLHKPLEFLFTGNGHSAKLDNGPFKGLRTNEAVASAYNDMLKDLDTIRNMDAERLPVAVIGLLPFTYLYMNLPYGTYSAWYEYDEPERLAAYWQLRPQRVPSIIYVPFFDGFSFQRNADEILENRMSGILELVSGDITEGVAGYIITNVSLKNA